MSLVIEALTVPLLRWRVKIAFTVGRCSVLLILGRGENRLLS